MKMLLIALLAITTCISCQKKTVKECNMDYKQEMKNCDKAADDCERDAQTAKEKCKEIKEPAQKAECLKDAKVAEKACDADKDKCEEDAKKDKDKCKQNAKP